MKNGWQQRPLGDVLEVQNGYAFDSEGFNTDRGIPLVRIRSLKAGVETETRFSGEFDKKYIVNAGDLLIGMDGEFGCYEWMGEPALLNQRVCRLQGFSSDIEPRFVFYGVNDYLKEIEEVTGYATVKHLSSRQILVIRFPVPPICEQQRIVGILDEAFEGIATAKANAEKNLQNVRELFNIVISFACLGELTQPWRKSHSEVRSSANSTAILHERRQRWEEDQIAAYKSKGVRPPRDWKEKYKTPAEPDTSTLPALPEGWKTLSVSQATHRLTYGITVRPKYVDNGIPIISGREIRSGEIDLDIAKRVSQEDFNGLREKCKLQLNDVLFGKTGTIGTVARVKADVPLCVSQNVALLSPLIDPEYLELVMRSPVIQQMARRAILDAAIPDLQLRFLERFPVPLPPEKEQRAIITKVAAIREECHRLECIYERKLASLKALKKSLLHQAFSGDL